MAEIGNGGFPPDRRHAAHVLVAERFGLGLARDLRLDQFRNLRARLLCRGRQARQGPPGRVHGQRRVADDEDLRMAW